MCLLSYFSCLRGVCSVRSAGQASSTPHHGSWWVCREGEGAEWLVPGMAELYPHIPHPFPPPQPPPLQGSEPLPLTRGFAHMKLCNYTGNLIPKGMRERGWAGKDCQVYYLGVCWLGWFFCFSFCCRWQSTCKSLPCVHYWVLWPNECDSSA